MLKVMKKCWDLNKNKLRDTLASRTDLNSCGYEDLVKLTFDNIYNSSNRGYGMKLNTDCITVINDGDYQGTLLFAIPFDTYQPDESEYILTYIGYGSCSGCDALQAAQSYSWEEEKLTPEQLADFMCICKDLICNAVKPYNYGWRHEDKFDVVEEEIE